MQPSHLLRLDTASRRSSNWSSHQCFHSYMTVFVECWIFFFFFRATTAGALVVENGAPCTLMSPRPRHISPRCLTVWDCLKCHMTGCVALLETLYFNAFFFCTACCNTGFVSLPPQPWLFLLFGFWMFSPLHSCYKRCRNGILTNLHVAPYSAVCWLHCLPSNLARMPLFSKTPLSWFQRVYESYS